MAPGSATLAISVSFFTIAIAGDVATECTKRLGERSFDHINAVHDTSLLGGTGPAFTGLVSLWWMMHHRRNLIDTAPFDRDVELVDSEGAHSLSFPCRHIEGGWNEVETKKRLYCIHPTHWRDWSPDKSSLEFFRRTPFISLTLLYHGLARGAGND
jgi:hypothetical protein